MKTIVLNTEGKESASLKNDLKQAGEIIRSGGLVAFPTETVYGLGANALDEKAAKKIYEAKGRPSDNPLIVHISAVSELRDIVCNISDGAKKLMDAFWPGPLTIIFKKKDSIPDVTSGGLPTVAVRFPENKIARMFIRACGVPVAAPSANISGRPSPTSADHVKTDLMGRIDMIIDGGEARFGLESTIVDMSAGKAVLLRPGSVTVGMLKEVLGDIEIDKTIISPPDENLRPLAPGMKYKHYSPICSIKIIKGEREKAFEKMLELATEAKNAGEKAGIISTIEDKAFFDGKGFPLLITGSENRPAEIGAELFKILRLCDELKLTTAFIKALPETGLGLSIMNRLKKAAGYDITEV